MDYRERGSHARGTLCGIHTSCMGSPFPIVGADKRNSNRVARNREERNVGMKGKNPKQDLFSAKDLLTELIDT